MCGILSVFCRGNGSVSEEVLLAGTNSLHHRGPDNQSIWVSLFRKVGLGHTRLSIIGLDNGNQPVRSEFGSVSAVVNGEFYDYEPIRRDMVNEGCSFDTESDSEILIPLYQKYGMPDCLQYLRGEFSFILWDENLKTLFVCRDRFGIKPLIYAERNGIFYVASEAKALFAMGIKPQWDENTIQDAEYFVREMEGTYFKGVKNVRAGCYLEITEQKIEEHQYWDFNYPDISLEPSGLNEREYIEEFKAVLEEAVRLRLRADVPVGCYLSGGLDSAAILGLMTRTTSAPINAYTISFRDKNYDEAALAREMAEFAGVHHSVVSISENDLAQNFADALWHCEAPMINGNGIAKFLLSRHVRNCGQKVVLTGEGADEVLAGYSFFREDAWVQQAARTGQNDPSRLSQLHANNQVTAGLFDGGDPDANMHFVESKLGYVPTQLRASTLSAKKMRMLRTDCFNSRCTTRAVHQNLIHSLNLNRIRQADILNRSLYIHSKSVLPNFILTALGDRSEMAHSIEGRLPFLDHKVVEYLAEVPASLKINGTAEKYLLREVVRGCVTDVLYKRQKHPFVAPPMDATRSSPLRTLMADTFHGSELKDLPFYDQCKVIKFFEQAMEGNSKTVGAGDITLDITLMSLLSLCLMQKRFGIRV